MPTVLTHEGFYVRIRTNDHTPAHVHVVKNGGEAKIALGIDGEPPQLIRVSRDMSARDARSAFDIVVDHNDKLLEEWRKVHE